MSKLVKLLKKQLKIEKGSIKLYDSFIKSINDRKAKKQIRKIKDDEKEHVLFVMSMISMIKS